MSFQIDATNGQQPAIDQITTTGSKPDSYRQIRTAVREQVSDDSSRETVRDVVLKALWRHVPSLGVADVHDLRVSLTVNVADDTPVDAQVTAVLQTAAATLAEWNHL